MELSSLELRQRKRHFAELRSREEVHQAALCHMKQIYVRRPTSTRKDFDPHRWWSHDWLIFTQEDNLRVRTGDEVFLVGPARIGTSMMECQQVEEERKLHPSELKVQSKEELGRENRWSSRQFCVCYRVHPSRSASSDWESHRVSGKLIVKRIGRTGGCGEPLGHYMVKWKLLLVCWADGHDSGELRQNGPAGRCMQENTSTQSARVWRTMPIRWKQTSTGQTL